MPEIRPDMSDENRCVSVHWNLPVQCVLPSSHRENWHEAWHPETGNRLRYRRSFGNYVTEDLHHGEWHDLEIPPPNGFCNEHYPNVPGARCRSQYGHGWSHQVVFEGCRYSWNTPIPKGLTLDQLTRDVRQLRGMLVAAHSRIAELEDDKVRLVDQQSKDDNEYAAAIAERDRFRLAWKSASFRAEARGEGIERIVKDRESYQGWLEQEQANTQRLTAELARAREDLAFLDRATLPELRRTVQHHEDGKKRWRERAEKAEARIAGLEAASEPQHFGICFTNVRGHRLVNGHCLYCGMPVEEATS